MKEIITKMIGLTFISVENKDNCELIFTSEDGIQFIFYHDQDCCECVSIDDICGDLEDLVGSPLLVASEETNLSEDVDPTYEESYTWTFYKFATLKGYVDVKWYGESNGYYSESVDLKIIEVNRIEEDI